MDKWMDGEGGKERGIEQEIYQQSKSNPSPHLDFL